MIRDVLEGLGSAALMAGGAALAASASSMPWRALEGIVLAVGLLGMLVAALYFSRVVWDAWDTR